MKERGREGETKGGHRREEREHSIIMGLIAKLIVIQTELIILLIHILCS